MSDREKLIELLNNAGEMLAVDEAVATELSGCENGWIKDKMGFIADYLIANGVTVQKWIPVSEPPKKRGTYQVYIHDEEWERMRVWCGCFQPPCHWSVYDIYGNSVPCEVFFWMPWAEPPKECE